MQSSSDAYPVSKDGIGLTLSVHAEKMLTLPVLVKSETKERVTVRSNFFVFQLSAIVYRRLNKRTDLISTKRKEAKEIKIKPHKASKVIMGVSVR